MKKMDSWKQTLLELILGILFFGIVIGLAGMLLVKNRMFFLTGLFIGLVIAVAMVTHMAFSLNRALDWSEKQAKSAIYRSYTLRFLMVVVTFGLNAYFQIGNVIACFLGMMTLKMSAHSQPYIHRLVNKYIFKNPVSQEVSEVVKEGGKEDGDIIDAINNWIDEDNGDE